MTRRIEQANLLARDEIVCSPQARACQDQNFELPSAIFGAMAALFFGFMAVLAAGLSSPGLVVPMAVNFAFLAAFFAVPAIMARVIRDDPRPRGITEFMEKGLETATGHNSGFEAVVLVLTLPALIFFWGLVTVTIVALV